MIDQITFPHEAPPYRNPLFPCECFFGGGSAPTPPKPQKPPKVTIPPAPVYTPPSTPVPAAEANADTKGDAASAQSDPAKRRIGPATVDRQGTILTGGDGDPSAPAIIKKTLLGG